MPKFEGVHQPFNPKKPYWMKVPKTEQQRKHFEKMRKAVKSRKHQPTNANGHPKDDADDHQDYGLMVDQQDQDDNEIPRPDFIDEIHQARLDDERHARDLLLAQAAEEMFSAYLACSLKTSEWGNPATWNHDHKATCNCHPSQWRERDVDLVDLLTRQKTRIRFCRCQKNDQTRLILMGFIGGSPKYPKTAFSIRLLRFFHILWKFCTIRIGPFSRAIDEFLDAFCALILTKNEQPRRWHTPLYWAVDAYREMLSMTEKVMDAALNLTPLDKVASNCPRCFGPPLLLEAAQLEPDVVVCMDGNFQHRRHIAAGTKAARKTTQMPPLFLPDDQVNQMCARLAGHAEDDFQACADQHTTANDTRGKGHWAGCDETGLMAMVCRHDHSLRFANIVKSGEKLHYSYSLIEWILNLTRNHGLTPRRVGILYDIGCTMQAGIENRGTFQEEMLNGRIRFGTSVFHAYVHRWGCQLLWNPRLNQGWGLSDGEGSERVWSGLSPLVSPLRYATPQHRVNAISMRSSHANACLRHEAVIHLRRKKTEARTRLEEAEVTLRKLSSPGDGCPGRDIAYYEATWMAQRARQLDIIEESQNEKREKLGVLLTLEEGLHVALQRLEALRATRRRARTQAERNELVALPATVADFEEHIHAVVTELGGNEFQNILGLTSIQTNASLTITIARAKMYEARVGVIEARLRQHRNTGLFNPWLHSSSSKRPVKLETK
ncbi:uncharacterized protein MELLADRAFT_87766 [Melampsora larici-populina 98AG31]|uniref:CxC1-like cysteine cluster associated with KDZ transposases domain-containing protein n=1 Tax=Melampsora larici-populina (strain 98AG31 / pathotype 3-4-7) TaxID=747676 RepID=F4SDZ4_MELLP|nr:uncharacterized protein MELLADRAFT_87766 [Melampsora larici-populina 98AG31]EGF97133.1 hypothetical protein MELLADRAFT_87766 [Melampsora larici-populina 98AG31]